LFRRYSRQRQSQRIQPALDGPLAAKPGENDEPEYSGNSSASFMSMRLSLLQQSVSFGKAGGFISYISIKVAVLQL
jgi:hypothetical protein